MSDADDNGNVEQVRQERALRSAHLFAQMTIEQRLAVFELVNSEVAVALAGRSLIRDPSDREFWRAWRDPNWANRADREDAFSEALDRDAAATPQLATIEACTLALNASLKIELEREDDGRWLAVAVDLPGVLAYGKTRNDAMRGVEVLALRVVADRIEQREGLPESVVVSVRA